MFFGVIDRIIAYHKKQSGELSIRAVVFGLTLSIIMAASNVYLGLRAGMTVSASVPSSVLAFLLLRGIFKDGTVLEANQIQTAASAGESIAAGIIFTMPALVVVGFWDTFDWITTSLISFSGGLLGILLMIPMRRVFITSGTNGLLYPEGIACAAVLKTGMSSKSYSSSYSVLMGSMMGSLYKFIITFLGISKEALQLSYYCFDKIFYIGFDISSVLIAVGFIVRANVALLIFCGGFIGWFILLPFFSLDKLIFGYSIDLAWGIWKAYIRYVGVGAMLIGGVISVFKVRRNIVDVIKEIRFSFFGRKNKRDLSDGEDISLKFILILIASCFVLITAIYFSLTKSFKVSLITSCIMIILAFFAVAIASYMAGLVGSSNTPISGVVITVLLLTGGILSILGFTGRSAMLATLGVSAVICCASATANDIAQDLKTGSIIGASPFRQQIMQILGVGCASVFISPVLQLLHDYTPGGIGGRELSAPQASLFSSLVEGLFGSGEIPWELVYLGSGIAITIYFLDCFLSLNDDFIRLHVMPVAIGLYLPASMSISVAFGAIISEIIYRINKGSSEKKLNKGILFSSGVIAGESLMGIGIAVSAAFGISRFNLITSYVFLNLSSFLMILSMLVLFFINCKNKNIFS